MEGFRYFLALFLVLFAPGVFLFWFSIHPYIHFWSKVGPRLNLAIHYGLILVLALGIFQIRRPLLSVEFGTRPILVVLAVPILALSIVLHGKVWGRLGTKVLLGLPELGPREYPSRLITEGIYSRIRHPRYGGAVLGFLAYALVSNYLAAYLVVVLSAVWVVLLAGVEEKELRGRFAAEYEAYCVRAPILAEALGRLAPASWLPGRVLRLIV